MELERDGLLIDSKEQDKLQMTTLSMKEIKALSKHEAQRRVQENMRRVQELLVECEAIADVHRFVVCLPTQPTWAQLEYLPKNLNELERRSCYNADETGLKWCGIQDHFEGGEWVSSSEFGEC